MVFFGNNIFSAIRLEKAVYLVNSFRVLPVNLEVDGRFLLAKYPGYVRVWRKSLDVECRNG